MRNLNPLNRPDGPDEVDKTKGIEPRPHATNDPDSDINPYPAGSEETLSATEIEELSVYINEIYLQDGAIQKINNQFCDDSSVQLKNFLKVDVARVINETTHQADTRDNLGGLP